MSNRMGYLLLYMGYTVCFWSIVVLVIIMTIILFFFIKDKTLKVIQIHYVQFSHSKFVARLWYVIFSQTLCLWHIGPLPSIISVSDCWVSLSFPHLIHYQWDSVFFWLLMYGTCFWISQQMCSFHEISRMGAVGLHVPAPWRQGKWQNYHTTVLSFINLILTIPLQALQAILHSPVWGYRDFVTAANQDNRLK